MTAEQIGASVFLLVFVSLIIAVIVVMVGSRKK